MLPLKMSQQLALTPKERSSIFRMTSLMLVEVLIYRIYFWTHFTLKSFGHLLPLSVCGCFFPHPLRCWVG